MAEVSTTEMAETFIARREVNLGWCKRQAGDLIPEYTDSKVIQPRTLDLLIRNRYVERRLVSQKELEEFQKAHQRPQEGSGAVSRAESPTSAPEPATEAPSTTEEQAPDVVEESIDDLGPAEDDGSPRKKRIVRKKG